MLKRLNVATMLEICGLGFMAFGCFLLAPFLGFIVTGFSLLILGVATGRGRIN